MVNKYTILVGTPTNTGRLLYRNVNIESKEKITVGDEIRSLGIILKILDNYFLFSTESNLHNEGFINNKTIFLHSYKLIFNYERDNIKYFEFKNINLIHEIRKYLKDAR